MHLFFSNSTFSLVIVDNNHTKDVSSTNFSSLEQKLLIKIADPTENNSAEKENIEETDVNRNIKAYTFKKMAGLTRTDSGHLTEHYYNRMATLIQHLLFHL